MEAIVLYEDGPYPLSTPCNGFARRVYPGARAGAGFQLHVMDSREARRLALVRYGGYLSTPCNGFSYRLGLATCCFLEYLSTPCNGFSRRVRWRGGVREEWPSFQLHVMDSRNIHVVG